MPEDKLPRLAEPPLNKPVAQYPTPLVPAKTLPTARAGDVILIEKQSMQIGSWIPQPLDGSITYAGIDANLFPSPLYLVYQRPTDDGVFVMNYWASDRSLSSQNAYNYDIQYSNDDPNTPIYIRTYITPRTAYAVVAAETADPTFGGAVIVKQQMKEYEEGNPLRSRYVQVVRVFQKLPSSILTGYQWDETLAQNIKITQQEIDPNVGGYAPYTPTTGDLSSEDKRVSQLKTVRTISSLATAPAGGGLILSRTEYDVCTYAAPNLLYGLGINIFNTPTSETIVTVQPNMRPQRSYETVLKTIRNFYYGNPYAGGDPTITIFDPLAITILFEGLLFKINIPNVLCDDLGSTTVTTLPSNPTYGYVADTFTQGPTSPTASAYTALIGGFTPDPITWTCKYWKSNIWIEQKQYVLLK